MWFCIPFTLATTMGLSALALDLPITLEEAGQGDCSRQQGPSCTGSQDARFEIIIF